MERTAITARGKSRRLQRVLSDFGAEHSFRQSGQRLKEHYGFELHATAVRDATLQQAARAAAQLEAHYTQSFRVLPKTGPQYLVAEADGTMICTVSAGRKRQAPHPREWKEMRLSAARPQGGVATTYAAGFLTVEETGRRWGHCARDAGWSLGARLHVVADGAEWIRLQCQETFGEQAEFLLDFFHVSEYLAAAAETCRPKAPRSWLHTQQQRLRRGAADKVLGALAAALAPATVPDEEAPVRSAHGYLSRRRSNLDYPKALARELPIGSGLIESGHKHVLQARLKKPGCAWSPHNAHALAQLRVIRANQQWDLFWQDRKAA
ncbi:MAG: UPF0236 family protein [Chthoniobacter sp.]